MAASDFISIESVNAKKTSLLIALKHNKRTQQSGKGARLNIDATRTHLNYALIGSQTPEELNLHANIQMLTAGINIKTQRKNAVLAVEIVYSLPINRHEQDTRQFFIDCLSWTQQNFKCELLSFDVHLDESAPHAHALILPIIDGRLQGDKLKGDRHNIKRLRSLFYNAVSINHGLSRAVRMPAIDKTKSAEAVLAFLVSDPFMRSKAYPCFRDAIIKDPLPFVQALGINLSGKIVKVKSFVDHKRSHGKGSFIR